jgi:hypothetical protein
MPELSKDQPERTPQAKAPDSKYDEKSSAEKEKCKNSVKQWLGRIRSAKEKQKDAFEEMRQAMRFASGLQWPGQKKRDDGRYVANFINHEVNKKVASLYARNPMAEYQRRKRLDFQIYNGKLESLQPLIMQAMQSPMGLAAIPLEQRATLLDYQHGMAEREMIDRVGKTMEIAFQYLLDEQDEEEGDFKLQMKQLVRRVVTCKVAYVRVAFVRDGNDMVTSSGLANTVMNKAKQLSYLMDKVADHKIEETSAQYQTMQNLAVGLGGTLQQRVTQGDIKERIIYDALPSTCVLVDPRCRQLKGFIGARWVAVEYALPVDDVNALFDVSINPSEIKATATLDSVKQPRTEQEKKMRGEETVKVYEVIDKDSRTHFFITDSHSEYLQEPQAITPHLRGFWPLAALTFNDVEADPMSGMSIFPPSDVELLRSAQKEWNRTREELKKHRKANAPGWMVKKGMLTEEDKANLESCATNEVIEMVGVQQGEPLTSVFAPKPKQPIEAAVYDTSPFLQDILASTGSQQGLPEAVQARATATGQTIEAQKQMTVTASNVDDLDDLLSWLARVSSEIMLQEFSIETIQRIVGPGAVWPTMPQDRQNFLNQIYLTTKAASSGRPNKGIEMSNWRIAAPILLQAGANPQFLVRETLRRLDENVDPEQAFPLVPVANPAANLPPSGGQHQPSDQEAHVPGVTPPPMQSRPGPGTQEFPLQNSFAGAY